MGHSPTTIPPITSIERRFNMAIYKVSKTTAACCQLDTAIKLLLTSEDDVSVCVLIHSAWSILKDLHRHKNSKSSRDWVVECFPDDKPKDTWKVLDSNWNFFKHANTEHNEVLDFDAGYLEYALMFALNDFGLLSAKSTSMEVYQLWFIAKYQEYFTEENSRELLENANNLFPDLPSKPANQQRNMGLLKLNEEVTQSLPARSR